jgi:hypothetical protein
MILPWFSVGTATVEDPGLNIRIQDGLTRIKNQESRITGSTPCRFKSYTPSLLQDSKNIDGEGKGKENVM